MMSLRQLAIQMLIAEVTVDDEVPHDFLDLRLDFLNRKSM